MLVASPTSSTLARTEGHELLQSFKERGIYTSIAIPAFTLYLSTHRAFRTRTFPYQTWCRRVRFLWAKRPDSGEKGARSACTRYF